MDTQTGLDVLASEEFRSLKGKTIGVVCHQASLARDLVHILDKLLPLNQAGELKIAAVFGPQHGIWGHTQDNMIEWEGYVDERTDLRFFSLYGEHREPTPAMLKGIDTLVVDVQDVGTRYYTFIWTLANCMKACEPLGIKVLVLDRPNPITGTQFEGPGADPAFKSFVGLHPLPVRHGMTIGEIALYLKDKHYPKSNLEIVAMKRWNPSCMYSQTGLKWAMPSPNMPSEETATVYPGQCLLEGTKLSEGRGTTRPFEMFGAPYIDGWEFCDAMNGMNPPAGSILPTDPVLADIPKYAGREVCQGAYLHVTDRKDFHSVKTTAALLHTIRRLYGEKFEWLSPCMSTSTTSCRLTFLWWYAAERVGGCPGSGPANQFY
ncbi:MAG: DUF1343 domain-containing protein [Fimbriimonadaceae bacterium]